MNDISLSEYSTWEPLGYINSSSDYKSFTGTFDGNGHTIRDLTIKSGSKAGLFGCIQSLALGPFGTIKNLVVEGNVTGGNNTGILVGWLYTGIIINCHSSGSITSTGTESSHNSRIGGLVGYAYDSTISASSSSASVNASFCEGTGGLIGFSWESSITSSYSEGEIKAENCTSTGGLTGQCWSSTVTSSYSTAKISEKNCFQTGGFAGDCSDNSTVTSSYATGSLEAGPFSGGFIGYDSSSTITGCYAQGK